MSDLLYSMAAATSGMQAQSTRLRVVSENMANADTPGYRRKLISFTSILDAPQSGKAVQPSRISLDQSELERVYDPAHPLADANGYYDGANVDMITEIADAREAQRSYEANLRMFDQSRKMIASLFELLQR